MAGTGDNRTEKPTSRKLQKAREKGQVTRSKEVASAVVFVGGVFFLVFAGQSLVRFLATEMRTVLTSRPPVEWSVQQLAAMLRATAFRTGMILGPFLLMMLVLGVGANAVQGGFVFSWQTLALKPGKLNPSNGLSKIFSKNGIVELVKNLAILAVVSVLTYQVVKASLPLYPHLILMDVRQLLHWTSSITYQVCVRVGIFLILLALGDYAFQRYRFMEQLKMTKQEIKEEHKDMEGDPLVKGRVRRIQRELARKRMMQDVVKADVVITNPTHYAVALSYKLEKMEAPQVLAKGVGFLAQRIKELAHEHNIPTVENKPLAQTLYKTVEIGEYIPATLYKAVAEILAYIYKARNDWRR